MKKYFFILMSVISLVLTSCVESNATAYMQEVKRNSNKSGIVLREYTQYFDYVNIKEVRLNNGIILKGSIDEPGTIGREKNQPNDFYFVQSGDTIIYDGDDVIEVRFKD